MSARNLPEPPEEWFVNPGHRPVLRVPIIPAEPAPARRRWPVVVLSLLVTAALGSVGLSAESFLNVGEGSTEPVPTRTSAPSPTPSPASYDPDALALNAARAAAHVIATIPNPDQGRPLIDRIFQDVSRVTEAECFVGGVGVETPRTRRQAERAVALAPSPAAFERVAYAEEYGLVRDRFVVVSVEVVCR